MGIILERLYQQIKGSAQLSFVSEEINARFEVLGACATDWKRTEIRMK